MKALIAMSGGVDSSVAAYLIKKSGYDCIGATMQLIDKDLPVQHQEISCSSFNDIEDARAVANKLGIDFQVFNFSDDFRNKVVGNFVSSYLSGNTPNPCIDCNKYIKWPLMFSKIHELGLDYVVTGHYARIEQNAEGKFLLRKGKDPSKDQSYVLYNMTQEQLSHTLFPLGDFTKQEIREIAEQNGFINAKKKDSQDICFVPNGDYAGFIERYTSLQAQPGNFVDADGNVLGTHSGIIHYTIGQRKGLGVAFGKPVYVCAKNATDNTVVLSDEPALFKTDLIAKDFNWISGESPAEEIRVAAKTRYSQKEQPATAKAEADGTVSVRFDNPQRAITPGQAVVLYQDDILLGGGTII